MDLRLPPFVLLLTAGIFAQEPTPQEPAKRPARSLAAGLVRQQVEIAKLQPPLAKDGLEIGAGTGPLVLLVRRTNGALELQELQRGDDDRGPAADPKRLDAPLAENVVISAIAPPTVRLDWLHGNIVAFGDRNEATEWCRGQQLDAALLRPKLEAMLAAAKAKPSAGQLQIKAAATVPMQHVLGLWELARGLGYQEVLFHGRDVAADAPAAARELIAGLAARFEWPTRRGGHNGELTVCAGELLVLLDGPSTWGDVGPLFHEFARCGIWRIGFVVRKDAHTFVKLPTNLPLDRGV